MSGYTDTDERDDNSGRVWSPDSASLWRYRCDCGTEFTNTYGRSGTAYCEDEACQRICTALEPQ